MLDARFLLPATLAALSLVVVTTAAAANRLVEVDVEIDGRRGVAGLGEATAVVVAPDGRHVYVASHHPPGAVAVFTRDATTGVLDFVESHTHAPDGPALSFSLSVDVSPDGRHVYVAAYGSAAVTVFARDAASGRLTFVESLPSGPWPFSLYKVWSVRVSPDGAHVYAAVSGDDRVAVLARSVTTGTLDFVQSLRDGEGGVSGLAKAVALLVTPDGRHLYAVGAESDAAAHFDRNPATGVLTFVGTVAAPTAPHAITVSADGRHAYVLGTGTGVSDQALAIYDRDPTSGVLTETGVVSAGVAGASGSGLDGAIVLDPLGDRLMLTRWFPAFPKLSVFARDPVAGGLALAEELEGIATTGVGPHHLSGPVGGGFDPSGTTYYAASHYLHAVTAFRTAAVACSATPLACREPQSAGGSTLSIRDHAAAKSDRLKWTWAKGATATDVAAFGDPVATVTDYALCLYEGAALTAEYLAAAASHCRGKPCWKAAAGGFRFSHPETMPDGLQQMKLKGGPAGAGSITVGGKGVLLDLPALPLAAPVTVQLQAANGECWSATFTIATANGPGKYHARSQPGPP